MKKYRGVLLVPTVIEFESDGSHKHITEQALRVARGMGKCASLKDPEMIYEPKLMEVCITDGKPVPTPLLPDLQVVMNEPLRG